MQQDTGREQWIDIFKAFLIFSVVIGHSWLDFTDIIFWYHMPLFFVISGVIIKIPEKGVLTRQWVKKKTKRFMVPYFIWFIIACILEKNLTIGHIVRVIWGGAICYRGLLVYHLPAVKQYMYSCYRASYKKLVYEMDFDFINVYNGCNTFTFYTWKAQWTSISHIFMLSMGS